MAQRLLPGFAELRLPDQLTLVQIPPKRLPTVSAIIFPAPVPCTPQSWEHVALRPDGKDGRHVLERLDFPGWTKHHLVQRHAETNNWRGTLFQDIVSGMYSLDQQLCTKEWLSDSECIAGINLVTIGLSFVTVAPQYCWLTPQTGGGGVSEKLKAEWTIGKSDYNASRFLVILFYHGGGMNGHWTVCVWDKENAELYHYDALAGHRGRRAETVALAWEQYLQEQGMEQRYLFVVPPQVPQQDWECGLLAILNVYNFFRPHFATFERIPWGGHGKECSHLVGSWDASHPKNTSSLEPQNTIERLVVNLRSEIYAFFGQPLNVPLNPRYPFILGYPPEYLVEKIRRQELVWMGSLEKTLNVETAKTLRREAMLWEERSRTAGALVRASKHKGERAISDRTVERFLRAATSAEAFALVPSNLGQMMKAYDPYSNVAIAWKVEWPFRPIISTARADFQEERSLKPPEPR